MRGPITTSASDEGDEAHSPSREREAVKGFSGLLSEINRVERGNFKLSDRGALVEDHGLEIVACRVEVRLTHNEILSIFEGNGNDPRPMNVSENIVITLMLNECVPIEGIKALSVFMLDCLIEVVMIEGEGCAVA